MMARTLLEEPSRAVRIDGMSKSHHRHRHGREPPLSTVVRSMMPVAVGLRPAPHAAARWSEALPASSAAPYDIPDENRMGDHVFPGRRLQITRSALPIRCYPIIIEENVG